MVARLILLLFGVALFPASATALVPVTSQSNAEGTITVHVSDQGMVSENWHISVTSHSDGSTYTVIYSPATGAALVTTPDFTGPVYSQLNWALTSLEPEYFGSVVHSNGTVVYPPGVAPPGDGPPVHVQGTFNIRRHASPSEPHIQILGCAGNAFVAIGAYILGGEAAGNFVRGAVRGVWAGPGSGAGMGALATILGASVLVVDACMVQ